MVQPLRRALIALVGLFMLSGCASKPSGLSYQAQQPTLNLFEFFDGKVTAWGIVQDRNGDVIQRFKVDIDGRIEGQTLTLDETFEYQLGEGPLTRTWTITHLGGDSYTGRADDILGEANGTAYGNAFNWAYEMDLVVDETSWRVSFDDWFWSLDNATLMNRSQIRKFGIVFADVTIFMQREPAAQ